tara:strand:- start:15868 stop:17535 length:1668 start_codon:yes stop_codon:yes gene_type:complete
MAFSKARRLGDLITANAEQFITSAHITDTAITGTDIHSTFDLTGKTVTVATASAGDNDTSVASTAFVQQEIASLVDSAPGTLNTLNELAAALGDDASFSTTVTNSIATKLPLAGGTVTGNITMGGMMLKPSGDGGSIGFNRNPDNGNHVGDSGKRRFQINGPDDTGGDFLEIQSYNSSGSHQGNVRIQDGHIGIGQSPVTNSLLTIKSKDAGTFPVRVVNSEDSDMLFGVYESSDGDGNNGMLYINDGSGNTDVKISTNGASWFNGGEVGIGTTSPESYDAGARQLVVGDSNTGSQGITIAADTNSIIYFADGTSSSEPYMGSIIYNHSNNDMTFRTNGFNQRVKITATGGLLVGSTVNQLYDSVSATGVVLHHDNSYSSCGAHIEIANDADSGWSPVYLQRFDWSSGDDGRFMQFAVNGGSDVGNITYDGTNFSVVNFSDYRLKENIVDYTGGLGKINALKVRSFNKKEGVSKDITQQGFIAHELSEHIPNAVIGTKDAMKVDETGETVPDYQQVTREALVPYLVSAIQELSAKLEAAEDIIEDLKSRIETLEG